MPPEACASPTPVFSHTLRPNFDGYDIWGERKYRFIADSLGFKDAAVRDIPLRPQGRRVILIGDSFTEGLGGPFEETFAGMLAAPERNVPRTPSSSTPRSCRTHRRSITARSSS